MHVWVELEQFVSDHGADFRLRRVSSREVERVRAEKTVVTAQLEATVKSNLEGLKMNEERYTALLTVVKDEWVRRTKPPFSM